MTTVIASREWIAADSLISGDPCCYVHKIIKRGARLFSGAGEWTDVIKLVDAICTDSEPELQERDAIDVVEVAPDGMFLWDGAFTRMAIDDEYVALGTGAAYALGAMDAGADVMQALEIAAKRDPATRGPFRLVPLHGATI